MITITTDFGYEDHYAGVMKGVIKRINPNAEIVDITHGVKRHSVRHASYILRSIVDYFPRGTVHLFVVDPGVGTERRGIVADLGSSFYVGPDNGILTLVKERVKKVYEIKMNAKNPTFHGRDIFAPVAAMVDMGDFSMLEEIADFRTYPVREPSLKNGEIEAEIIHVDHFGNVITNIPEDMVKEVMEFELEHRRIPMKKTYGNAMKGELLALINSEDLLEFAINMDSAERVLGLKVGDEIKIKIFKN